VILKFFFLFCKRKNFGIAVRKVLFYNGVSLILMYLEHDFPIHNTVVSIRQFHIIQLYENIVSKINRNSKDPKDAQGLTEEALRIYKKLLEATDIARRAADTTPTSDEGAFSREDLNNVLSGITTLRTTITGKIETYTKNRDSLLLVDNPEKIVAKSLKLQARQNPKLPNEFCQV